MTDSEASSSTNPRRIQWDSVPMLRGCATILAIQTGSLLIGGVGIFLILFGLYIAVSRALIFWPRTWPWMGRFLAVPLPVQPALKSSSFANLVHLFIIILFAAFGFVTFHVGVKILLDNGFLGQNLIYMLFFRP